MGRARSWVFYVREIGYVENGRELVRRSGGKAFWKCLKCGSETSSTRAMLSACRGCTITKIGDVVNGRTAVAKKGSAWVWRCLACGRKSIGGRSATATAKACKACTGAISKVGDEFKGRIAVSEAEHGWVWRCKACGSEVTGGRQAAARVCGCARRKMAAAGDVIGNRVAVRPAGSGWVWRCLLCGHEALVSSRADAARPCIGCLPTRVSLAGARLSFEAASEMAVLLGCRAPRRTGKLNFLKKRLGGQ